MVNPVYMIVYLEILQLKLSYIRRNTVVPLANTIIGCPGVT